MQPVLEIRKLGERSYTYTVRAPRMPGEPPPEACYVDLGLTSFSDCLRDAAGALTYFPRVYIRYEGLCVGEQNVLRLGSQADAVVRELMAAYGAQTDRAPAPASASASASGKLAPVVRVREAALP